MHGRVFVNRDFCPTHVVGLRASIKLIKESIHNQLYSLYQNSLLTLLFFPKWPDGTELHLSQGKVIKSGAKKSKKFSKWILNDENKENDVFSVTDTGDSKKNELRVLPTEV